jgi:hypothetical protein
MLTARAEIRRLECEVRRRNQKIKRLEELRNAAIEAADAYELACARVRILSTELDRAERRNNEETFIYLAQRLKAAFAEKIVMEKREIKANERLARLAAKLTADRLKWEESRGVRHE